MTRKFGSDAMTDSIEQLRLDDLNPGPRWKAHAGEVRCLLGLPEQKLISGGTDQAIKIWDQAAGGMLAELAVNACHEIDQCHRIYSALCDIFAQVTNSPVAVGHERNTHGPDSTSCMIQPCQWVVGCWSMDKR